MANLEILVWKTKEPDAGTEPEVEVKIPGSLARWVPRLMACVPKKTKEEMWGADADFDAIFADLEKLMDEAAKSGTKEIMDVKTRDSRFKILVA